MIVYDGIYRMPDQITRGFEPRSEWSYAWRVRIINLELNHSGVNHIKPMIIAVNQTGSKTCLTSCAESIGKRISRDFNLKISRILWIEQSHHKLKQWHVAVFYPKSSFGPDIDYHVQWRPIRSGEIELIKPFVSEVGSYS